MQYKCDVCHDSGSKNQTGDYLDCQACDMPMIRKALNDFVKSLGPTHPEDVSLAIHQRAIAIGLADSVEGVLTEMQPGGALHMPQEPVAHLKFWAAQSWSGNGNHDIDCGEGLEVCKPGEIGADGKPAFPVFLHAIPGVLAMAPKQEAPTGKLGDMELNHAFDYVTKPWAYVRNEDISRSRAYFKAGYKYAFESAPHSQMSSVDLAAPAAANGALTDSQINTIWESLPGLKIVAGRPIDHWNSLLRHEFARAILAAAGPDTALVQLIHKAQSILAHHLPPDGPDAKTTISALLGLLDGPESRAALSGAKVN